MQRIEDTRYQRVDANYRGIVATLSHVGETHDDEAMRMRALKKDLFELTMQRDPSSKRGTAAGLYGVFEKQGETIFHFAARHEQGGEVLGLLLHYSPDPEYIKCARKYREKPSDENEAKLHACVTRMLEKQDKKGHTPFYYAYRRDDESFMRSVIRLTGKDEAYWLKKIKQEQAAKKALREVKEPTISLQQQQALLEQYLDMFDMLKDVFNLKEPVFPRGVSIVSVIREYHQVLKAAFDGLYKQGELEGLAYFKALYTVAHMDLGDELKNPQNDRFSWLLQTLYPDKSAPIHQWHKIARQEELEKLHAVSAPQAGLGAALQSRSAAQPVNVHTDLKSPGGYSILAPRESKRAPSPAPKADESKPKLPKSSQS